MLQQYDFIYADAPAFLMFDEELGSTSELWYFDKGVLTSRVIEEFRFNERQLKITVIGKVTTHYDDVETFVSGPNPFEFDATGQETLDYFAVPSTKERVKRMMVNGTSIEYLGMLLFNPETGEFAPFVLPINEPAA